MSSPVEILGIVGHEEAKFTPRTKYLALVAIKEAITKYKPELVVSGACPLGGIDVWAVRVARSMGVATKEYAPKVNRWDGPGGFKERNLEIAKADVVVSIVTNKLPATYKGRVFSDCYHCKGAQPLHVKSGACWTALKAKKAEWIIIDAIGEEE